MSNNTETETVEVAMDMPKPPEGWRYKAYRPPLSGEHYRLGNGNAAKSTYDHPADMPAPILERVPWEPRVGKMAFITNEVGDVYPVEYQSWMPAWWCFQTQEQAKKFAAESRALADKIRAESEVENA